MIDYNPLLCLDFYKTCHCDQYPKELTKLVSYYTPRMSRLHDVDKITMFETMHNANGVGLAGPQVGILRRVVVIDAEDEDIELVNPEIVSVSDETQTGLEGCLSLPGKWGIVTRPLRATVRAQDRYGDWYEYEGEELLARAFLHEIDHLDGHLYPEIAEKMLTAEELEELRKQEEDAIEAEGEDE